MPHAFEHVSTRMTAIDFVWEWLNRLVALLCLALGLFYWVRMIGFYEGTLWRFDLMPVHWQVASVSLAVLFPFAASGLWMVASWGVVIWLLCALVETTMFTCFPDMFGTHFEVVAVHFAIGISFLGLRIALFLRDRKLEV